MVFIKGYLKSGFLYFGATFFGPIIGLLSNPLLAENLSHSDYAIVGYFTSFQALLIPVVGFNLNAYYLRNYHTTPEDRRKVLSDTILLGQGLVGAVAFFIFTVVFYIYYSFNGREFPFFPYAIYAFSQIYASIFATFYLLRLRIERKASIYALTTLAISVFYVFLTLLFVVYFKEGADGKLISALAASVLTGIYSLLKSTYRFQIDLRVLKEGLLFGFPLTVSALFWYFLTGVDKALLMEIGDTRTYGTYIVAGQIAGYVAIFYSAINTIVEPDIYKAIADKQVLKLRNLMLGTLCAVGAINLLYVALAPRVIGILTANRYVESADFSRILALQNITMAAYYLIVKLFVGYGFLKEELAVRIIGAGIAFVMFVVLVDRFGFYGAAWGQVFSFAILAILGAAVFYLKIKKNK